MVRLLAERFGWVKSPVHGVVMMPGMDGAALQTDNTLSGHKHLGSRKERLIPALAHLVTYRRSVVEGILVAHTKGRYVELALSGRLDYWFAFLDTPLDVCIERVRGRRAASSNRFTNTPFDPKNVVKEYHSVRKIRDWMVEDGRFQVFDLDHTDPVPAVCRLLEVSW